MSAAELTDASATLGPSRARVWVTLTRIVTLAVFFQAVTAGLLLDGDDRARDVHRTTAGLLVIVAGVGGLIAFVRLRHRDGGRRFGLMLLSIGVALAVQYGLGAAAADGKDTLWVHVPLGVAFVGLTMRLNMLAQRLGS